MTTEGWDNDQDQEVCILSILLSVEVVSRIKYILLFSYLYIN